jgi:hypothetical protein
MTILDDAVARLEHQIEGSGCEDAQAVLRRAPDAPRCQYVRGACLEVCFGGKSGHVATEYPLQGAVPVTSMFGAKFSTGEQRTAALAILNATAGFLSLARKLTACDPARYTDCFRDLKKSLAGKPAYAAAPIPVLAGVPGIVLVDEPADAETLLVTPAALTTETSLAIVSGWPPQKRIIFLGPSVAGVSQILGKEHWCPYGR